MTWKIDTGSIPKSMFQTLHLLTYGTTLRLMLLRGVAGPVAIAGPGANRVWKLHDLEEGD